MAGIATVLCTTGRDGAVCSGIVSIDLRSVWSTVGSVAMQSNDVTPS